MVTLLKHAACCVQVIDMGTQPSPKAEKLAHRREILFGWELVDPTIDLAVKPRVVYKCYGMNLGVDSSLRKDLERLLSTHNPDWFQRFTPKSLLGRYCVVTFASQSENLSSVYVKTVKALKADIDTSKLPKPKTSFGIFMISEPDIDLFERLPQDIRQKIRLSPEWDYSVKGASDYDGFF